MKYLSLAFFAGLTPFGAQACQRCAPIVRAGVFQDDFLINLGLIVMPLLLIGLLAMVLHRMGDRS